MLTRIYLKRHPRYYDIPQPSAIRIDCDENKERGEPISVKIQHFLAVYSEGGGSEMRGEELLHIGKCCKSTEKCEYLRDTLILILN